VVLAAPAVVLAARAVALLVVLAGLAVVLAAQVVAVWPAFRPPTSLPRSWMLFVAMGLAAG